MSKPATILEWATDANFPAGVNPWNAQPNKVEPSAAKVDVGRQPTELPPAEETNWWRSMVSRFVSHLVSIRMLNWSDYGVDTTTPVASGAGSAWAGCYDETDGVFTVGTGDGETVVTSNGYVWDDDGGAGLAGPNIGAGNAVTGIASDDSGTRVACVPSAAAPPGDEVFYSIAPGAWAACGFAAGLGLTFTKVESNGRYGSTGTWIIADTASPAAVYRSQGTMINFAVVAVTGLTTQYPMICASKDTDNDCWVILTATQCARSSDHGATWTTALHGLAVVTGGPAAGCLAANVITYDKATSRFIVFGGATSRDVSYSEDNGISWTTVTNALPATWTGYGQIITSRDGEILAHCGSLGYVGSVDGGETWELIHTSPPRVGGAGIRADTLMFGDGHFIGKSNTAWTVEPILSLRAKG